MVNAGGPARAARRAGVLVLSLVAPAAWAVPPQTPLDGASIPKFVDPLPTFVGQRVGGPVVYVSMKEAQQQVLPASYGFAPTTVWGYEIGGLDVVTGRPVVRAARFPGVTVEARQWLPTHVVYANRLFTPTLQALFPADQTIDWADPLKLRCVFQATMSMDCMKQYAGPVPTVVHLHGGEVPPAFDGGPDAWFTVTGERGSNYGSLFPVRPNEAVYRYPNGQEATSLWFHDHAYGITRLNVYGGVAALYFLRDDRDTGKRDNPLRLPAGAQEIELVLQDRSFDTAGQLLYHDPTQLPNPQLHPFWRPEFFGDVIVVNGKSWPTLAVEPRRYRFRFLNASNARFYDLALARAFTSDARLGPSLGMLVTDPGPAFWQIGTDGGRLDAPARVTRLLVAPGERADVVVDFSGLPAGTTLTLVNGANAPFPGGDPVVTGTTGQILQLTVSKKLSSEDESCDPARSCELRPRAPIVRLAAEGKLARGVNATVKRQLVLKEIAADPIPAGCDPAVAPPAANACLTTGGPREVLLNNSLYRGVTEQSITTATPLALSGSARLGANWATEAPRVGATEVWEVANVTEDAHPVHVHLIQFQVLNRQPLNTGTDPVTGQPFGYAADWQGAFPGGVLAEGGGPPLPYGDADDPATWNADGAVGGNLPFSPYLLAAPTPPAANEAGWKDTVVMYPGEVTRIAARWAPQRAGVREAAPGRNLFPFDPTLVDPAERDVFGNPGAAGYVWHCHILEHEDDEMMRPYAVRR